MSKFKVVVPKPVVKDFVKLGKRTLERLNSALHKLTENPFPGVVAGKAVKKLRMKEPIYRLRVGEYRVIYRVKAQDIVILKVVSRKDLEVELKKLR